MYNWTYNRGFEFYFTDKSNKIVDSIDWTSIQDDFLAQFSILNELLENVTL